MLASDPAVTNESVELTDGVTVLAAHPCSLEPASDTELVDTSGIVESLSGPSFLDEYSNRSTNIPPGGADGKLLAYIVVLLDSPF